MIEFQINKGVALRKLGLEGEAMKLLEGLTKKSSDPAIYYNMKCMKKTNHEV